MNALVTCARGATSARDGKVDVLVVVAWTHAMIEPAVFTQRFSLTAKEGFSLLIQDQPLSATHHPTRSDFWRRFPSAFSSSAMPERHRHHDSTERRKLFTITLDSCSRSGGIRVHDEMETVITMPRHSGATRDPACSPLYQEGLDPSPQKLRTILVAFS